MDQRLSAHDARDAYALFSIMPSRELRDLLVAHRLDGEAATTPEAIAFSGGRQALITAVLKTRESADPDPALLAAMVAELETREAPITLVLRPVSALHLAGLLQLALRHPGTSTSEAHHRIAVTFIEHVRAYFADAPAVLEVLRRGDDPSEDA